jgi:hypothetical protein
MTITTTEIRATFERLSSIDWNDYCELCAREHDEWALCEIERGAIEPDENEQIADLVEDNHWAYGHDYDRPRIGLYA